MCVCSITDIQTFNKGLLQLKIAEKPKIKTLSIEDIHIFTKTESHCGVENAQTDPQDLLHDVGYSYQIKS